MFNTRQLRFSNTLILVSFLFPPWGSSILKAATIPQSIKSSIQRRVDFHYTPSITIGVVDRKGRDYFTYGLTSLENGVLPNERTLYEIGSVTKVFTTTLLAQLASMEALSLSDPVEAFLPPETQVPRHQQRPITLAHLATHTSGLLSNPPAVIENSPLNPFYPFPPETLYQFLDDYQLPRTPGADFEYSNVGVGLLGHALALHHNGSYDEVLQEHILSPLGLIETFVTPGAVREYHRAIGHHGVVTRPNFNMDTLAPAGALLSSARDLLTFLEHQLGFQESPLETAIKETQRRHVSAGSPSLDVGLGWFITNAGSDQIHWHNGATMGQNSFVGFNLRTGVGVAVMANARLHQYSSVEDLGLKILIPAVPLNSIRRPATLNDSERDRFLGQYHSADGPSISIGRRADHLTATSSLNPAVTFTLYPSSSNRFHLYEAVTSATLRFTLNPDGQATEMQWTQEGETTFYTRSAPPGRLRIAVSPTGASLHIEGDSATVYHVESSPDLNQWHSLMSLRGNESTSISISNANAHRFFRIR